MAVHGEQGFNRAIHNIENSPFRTKFEGDLHELEGNLGIGCISDSEPQPLLVQSHVGSFAITTVGKINNQAELVQEAFDKGKTHFLEMSGGSVNATFPPLMGQTASHGCSQLGELPSSHCM